MEEDNEGSFVDDKLAIYFKFVASFELKMI